MKTTGKFSFMPDSGDEEIEKARSNLAFSYTRVLRRSVVGAGAMASESIVAEQRKSCLYSRRSIL